MPCSRPKDDSSHLASYHLCTDLVARLRFNRALEGVATNVSPHATVSAVLSCGHLFWAFTPRPAVLYGRNSTEVKHASLLDVVGLDVAKICTARSYL